MLYSTGILGWNEWHHPQKQKTNAATLRRSALVVMCLSFISGGANGPVTSTEQRPP